MVSCIHMLLVHLGTYSLLMAVGWICFGTSLPLGNDEYSLPMLSRHYELVEYTSTRCCCNYTQPQTQSSKLDPPSASTAWPHNMPFHTIPSCSMCFQIDAVSSSTAQPAHPIDSGYAALRRSLLAHQHVRRNARRPSRNLEHTACL